MVRIVIAALMLIVASAASLMLAIEHLWGVALPGCGPGSGCAEAAASAWGKVPGLGWPTSFVGMAFFPAMLVAWWWSRGRLGGVLSGVAIVGGLLSVVLTVAMLAGRYPCWYCLAAHAGNLVFVAIVLRGVLGSGPAVPSNAAAPAPRRAAPASGMTAFAIAAVILTGGLFVAERVVTAQFEASEQQKLEDSVTKLTQGGDDREGFTGRYRLGPDNAPIRMVVFSDFQCVDCKRVEGEIRQLMSERDDISVSAKNFPMSTQCNPHLNVDMHKNACWAARAAEAAGIIGGNEAFWRMHHWLFDRGGGFTKPELDAALPGLGFDVARFTEVMTSPATLELISADIEEAISFGIHYTPMIFINGVEFEGWTRPHALRTAVEAVAAMNPESGPPTQDEPPTAAQKYVEDWQEEPVRQLPGSALSWPMGTEREAPVRVVIWGDLQQPFTAEADKLVRAYASRHGDVKYEFRHYPIDQSCNGVTTSTQFPYACIAAKAELAAGRLGGAESYWKMHAWLIDNQIPLSDDVLRAAAQQAGVDHAALLAEMESEAIATAIQADAQLAKRHQLRSVPMVFVNERWAPRWRLDSEPRILERFLDLARDQ